MPYFFFDLEIGHLAARDNDGTQYPDREAAEMDARTTLLEHARYCLSFDEPSEITVTVRDETSVVFKATAHTVCRLT